MNKTNEQALADMRRRMSELKKELTPLRQALAQAEKDHQEILRKRSVLLAQVKAFEDDPATMTDADYTATEAKIKALTIRSKAAGDAYHAAAEALARRERHADGVINTLAADAMHAFDRSYYDERTELKKAAYAMAALLQEH